MPGGRDVERPPAEREGAGERGACGTAKARLRDEQHRVGADVNSACEQCGADFSGMVRRAGRRYCSRRCGYLWRYAHGPARPPSETRAGRGLTVPSKTLGRAAVSETEREVLLEFRDPPTYWRPKTRADCADVPRPCPYVMCRYNLYLEVNTHTGSLMLVFPDREPWDMPADWSCALDVADRGEQTLNDVGCGANITRERVRQIEVRGRRRLRVIAPETYAALQHAVAEDPVWEPHRFTKARGAA